MTNQTQDETHPPLDTDDDAAYQQQITLLREKKDELRKQRDTAGQVTLRSPALYIGVLVMVGLIGFVLPFPAARGFCEGCFYVGPGLLAVLGLRSFHYTMQIGECDNEIASVMRQREIRRAARRHGKRAVGPLLEKWDKPLVFAESAAIYEALTEVLPLLEAGDFSLFNSRHRAILNRQLERNIYPLVGEESNRDFCLAALKAIAQIGDEAAIPFVMEIAKEQKQANFPYGVQEAARECFLTLRQNTHARRASQTLLRASKAPADAPETLLRPASSGEETAPQQLLRAAPSGEDANAN